MSTWVAAAAGDRPAITRYKEEMATVLERTLLRWLHLRGAQSHFVPTTEGRTHVLTMQGRGSLPPVLLLHGFSAGGGQLAPLFMRLLPHVQRVVAPDFLGHGFSEMPDRGIDTETMREALMQSLDAVHTEPSMVFGNSMGGFAALRMNTDWPDRVLGLALSSPGGAPMTSEEIVQLRKGFVVDKHAQAVDFVDRVVGRRRAIHHLYALDVKRRMRKPQLQALLHGLKPGDLLQASEVSGVDKPVLFMWGRSDGVLPDASRQFFRQHLPGHAQIEEPEAWGHSPYFTRPKELSRMVLRFLQEPPGPKSPATP